MSARRRIRRLRAWAACRMGWSRALTMGLALTGSALISAEDITLTTYYPAPRGMYDSVQVQGDALIATTPGPGAHMDVGPQPIPWGPLEKVNVNGQVQAPDYVGIGAVPPPGSGMVMMMAGGCPAPWTPVGGVWNGRVLVGSGAFGATGGNPTHTHNLDHTHALPVQPGSSSIDGSHVHTGIDVSHPHAYNGSTGGGIPSTCCDQGCGFLEQCRQAAVGNHQHNFGGVTDANIFTIDSDADGLHFHDYTVTWTSPVEAFVTDAVINWPDYIEVVFCLQP
jgi:hypothetical protein